MYTFRKHKSRETKRDPALSTGSLVFRFSAIEVMCRRLYKQGKSPSKFSRGINQCKSNPCNFSFIAKVTILLLEHPCHEPF